MGVSDEAPKSLVHQDDEPINHVSAPCQGASSPSRPLRACQSAMDKCPCSNKAARDPATQSGQCNFFTARLRLVLQLSSCSGVWVEDSLLSALRAYMAPCPMQLSALGMEPWGLPCCSGTHVHFSGQLPRLAWSMAGITLGESLFSRVACRRAKPAMGHRAAHTGCGGKTSVSQDQQRSLLWSI